MTNTGLHLSFTKIATTTCFFKKLMAALWDMQEVSSLTRDWLCSLKKKKKPVKASNILISCLFSTFGSLKIIQTFHRV